MNISSYAAADIGLLSGPCISVYNSMNSALSLPEGGVYRHISVYDPPYQLYYQEPTGNGSYNPYSFSYYVPTMYPYEVSDALRLLGDIKGWIGPVDQSLVGSLFPVSLLRTRSANGVPVGIDLAQYKRLAHIHNVIEHVHAAADYDAQRTVGALTHPYISDGGSALTYLMADRYDEAYLAAIRALRPARAKGLMTGRGIRRALDATVAFLDED